MTAHRCPVFDPSCYRCDLSRDEVTSTVEGRRKTASTAHLHTQEGNKPFTVRLNPQQLALAQRLATDQGVTVVDVLRLGLTALDLMERA